MQQMCTQNAFKLLICENVSAGSALHSNAFMNIIPEGNVKISIFPRFGRLPSEIELRKCGDRSVVFSPLVIRKNCDHFPKHQRVQSRMVVVCEKAETL